MRSTRAVSIIVSTYNQPDWLYLSLFALLHQTIKDFEVVIADDGSGPRTADVVRALQPEFEGRLRHVWHADKGFRKNIILNEAVRQASGDYLIFIDGDIVARRDFVAAHALLARRDYFVSAGCFRLTLDVDRLGNIVHRMVLRSAVDMHWRRAGSWSGSAADQYRIRT